MFAKQEGNPGKGMLAWVGGKSLLADRIISLIPQHRCYVEVFAGGAWVLFKKPESHAEVINDINIDLVTLYRVVKLHLDEFIRYFRWVLVARDEFERFKVENPASLTDIQRAVRFYYLTKTCFGARIVKPSYGTSTEAKPRLNLLRIEEELSAAHLRLCRANIENLPYGELIDHYDRPHTFYYVDPPYFGCEDYYGAGIFSREDFTTLRDQLAGIKGKFCISINDTPEIRELFRDFTIMEVPTRYSVGSARQKRVIELLVMNYQPGK